MRFTLSLALLCVAVPASAQGYIGGHLLDSATASPLPCVQVSLLDTAGQVVARQMSSSDGAFQLDAPPRGAYRLRFFIWAHDPMLGPVELLEPSTERARKYLLTFREESKPQRWQRSQLDTAADAPSGPPMNPKEVSLRYPQELRLSGVQGDVTAHFVVDSTGRVVPMTVQIVRSTHHEFTNVVRKYLEKVQLQPARLDHRPVCTLKRDWPFTFRLGA
jgi:TonB family protein